MVQEVDILQVNTAQSVKSVSDLRKEIKELKGELLGLEQGTAAYNEKLVEVAEKTHQLKEVQEQINKTSQDFGDRISNVQGTVAGLTGAFQTVLGSLSLMGVQMGDDVKMLKMLQSAMAITQGVAAIDAGVKSFKALTISIKASAMAMSGLKRALLSSGIGIVLVAVGALVAKLSELKEKQDEVAEGAKRQAEAMKEAANYVGQAGALYDNISAKINKATRLSKARGEDELTVLKERKRLLEENLATEKQNLASISATAALYGNNSEWVKLVKDQKAVIQNLEKDILAVTTDIEVEQTRIVTEQARKRTEERKKEEQQALEGPKNPVPNTMQVQQSPLGDLQAQAQEADLQALTDYYNRRAEIVIANEKNVDDQLLQLDMDYRDQREVLLRDRLEKGLITQAEFDNELAQLEVEAAEFQIQQEERVTEKLAEELEKRKAAQQAWAKSVKSVAGSVSSILGTLGDNLEEGTEEWKNIKTAQAIIDTIAGSVTAFMTTLQQIGGIPGLIAGAAAAAATVAAGMAEVAKIKSTQVSKGSAPAASGSSSLGSVSASAVSVNATQVTPTRAVQTEADIANLPDTRVYVLERDITKVQHRVAVTKENATY